MLGLVIGDMCLGWQGRYLYINHRFEARYLEDATGLSSIRSDAALVWEISCDVTIAQGAAA